MFNTPVGVASEWAHPVEDTVSNLIPTLLGCTLMGSHAVVYWLWIAFRIAKTCDAHSGYRFEWSPFALLPGSLTAEQHDFHHSHNVGSYGSMTNFWDWLCGTNKEFYEYKASQQQHLTAVVGKKME